MTDPTTPDPIPPLRFDAPVLLVGGGELDRATLALASPLAPHVVAADSGADRLAALGGPAPAAVVGDMDSLADLDVWRGRPDVRLLHLAEQDTTDFEKCLYSVEAPLFLAIGFFGARLDHTLAALHAALRRPEKRVLFLGAADVCFPAPRVWRADLPRGARVSIWPGRPVRGLGSTGLEWPIDGLAFECGRQIGTSNRALGGRVEARFDRLGALILLDRAHLGAALASLAADGAFGAEEER